MSEAAESVRLDADVIVVATSTGFRVSRPGLDQDTSLLEHLRPGPGDAAVTRELLAGAVFAGFFATPEEKERTEERDPFLAYVHYLAGLYQTTRVTTPTMRRVAERFEEDSRTDLAVRCRRVAEEELGHDRLALMDLDALGVPGEALVARLQPAWALESAALLARYAESQPIACFGYAYALERTALMNSAATVARMESLARPGADVTRCLRIHSAAGADASHVKESVLFIAALPAGDRIAIVQAVYAAASVLRKGRGEYPGDAAMRAHVEAARRAGGIGT